MIKSPAPHRLFLKYCTASMLLFSCSVMPGQADTLRLCYENNDYFPFTVGSDDIPAKKKGILVDLVVEAAKSGGFTLQLHRLPWKRCISQVTNGDSDGLFAAIWLTERDEWGAYPKYPDKPNESPDRQYRLWTAEYPIFTHIDSSLEWDGEAFKQLNYGLGAPFGYVAEKKLKKLNALTKVNQLPEQGLFLVFKKRLDGYVIEKNIGSNIARKLKVTDKLKRLPVNFIEADWYVVFSHQYQASNPERVKQFWKMLSKAREKLNDDSVDAYFED